MTPKDIKQRVKTYEGACKVLGINPTKSLPIVKHLPKDIQDFTIAHHKLMLITKALNEDWTPDWSNRDQWKYSVWHEINASKNQPNGFGFSASGCGRWPSSSFVSSRLLYKSSELALYSGKQFKKLWKDYFLIK